MQKPIYQCPSCKASGTNEGETVHKERCRIKALIGHYFTMKKIRSTQPPRRPSVMANTPMKNRAAPSFDPKMNAVGKPISGTFAPPEVEFAPAW